MALFCVLASVFGKRLLIDDEGSQDFEAFDPPYRRDFSQMASLAPHEMEPGLTAEIALSRFRLHILRGIE